MEVRAALLEVEKLTDRLRAFVTVEADEEWSRLGAILDALDAEAGRAGLPVAKIREEIRRVRRHLGAVMGKDEADGHSRSQHLVWTLGAIDGLRSDHCFGSILVPHDGAEESS